MFILKATRSKLIEALTGRSAIAQECSSFHELRSISLDLDAQTVLAVWLDQPAENFDLPVLLVTAEGRDRDWLAWAATYIQQIRPFTAFCRVLDIAALLSEDRILQPIKIGTLAHVGLILGETLSLSDLLPRSPNEPLTTLAYNGALSFALARELSLRGKSESYSQIIERWSLVRRLTRQQERKLSSEIYSISTLLYDRFHKYKTDKNALGNPRLSDALIDLQERREVNLNAFFAPITRLIGADIAESMRETREVRVTNFERAAKALINEPKLPEAEASFVLGYLASRIAPGSLAHAKLILSLPDRYPSSILWYGVCAGLAPETMILTELGGLGRRILRDLQSADDFLSRPRADLAWMELNILLGGDKVLDQFVTASPFQLKIELAPGVWTVVNWSSRTRAVQPAESISMPRDERIDIAREIERASHHLMTLASQVAGGGADPGKGTQRELFPKRTPHR